MPNLGGIVKQSLIDYPGRIAAVAFLRGCNFACPYCHNPALINGGSPPAANPDLDPTLLFDHLERRRGFLEGVVVSGGEPTLQDDLYDFLARIKALGYRIKLDTNGSRPRVLAELFSRDMVDYVAMDIKTTPTHYGTLTQDTTAPASVLESIRIVMESGVDYEFRTTCLSPFVDAGILAEIGTRIRGARHYVLQRCRPDHVLVPDFFENGNRICSDNDLLRLKAIIAPFVERCTVR